MVFEVSDILRAVIDIKYDKVVGSDVIHLIAFECYQNCAEMKKKKSNVCQQPFLTKAVYQKKNFKRI